MFIICCVVCLYTISPLPYIIHYPITPLPVEYWCDESKWNISYLINSLFCVSAFPHCHSFNKETAQSRTAHNTYAAAVFNKDGIKYKMEVQQK